MLGAIPPLPPYAFVAWCSVKAQGQLYLYLTISHFSDTGKPPSERGFLIHESFLKVSGKNVTYFFRSF
jgi:hypothetical protein